MMPGTTLSRVDDVFGKHKVGRGYGRWQSARTPPTSPLSAGPGAGCASSSQRVAGPYHDGFDGPPSTGRFVSECYQPSRPGSADVWVGACG
jgi:hypothetical protein